MASNLQAKRRLGLYEKSLPDELNFARRMELGRELGFHYWEISIDESERRLSRLVWTRRQREDLRRQAWDLDFPLHSMCLSGHRQYPFGSKDPGTRQRAAQIMAQSIELAYDLGVRIIQLAGYDVYYEKREQKSHELFLQGLRHACDMAEKAGVILALEIMDTEYLNSIFKYLEIAEIINSPFLQVYPDLGNLFAWNNDLEQNLTAGVAEIAALHIKDARARNGNYSGQFRDLVIGEGEVDFVQYFKILKKLCYNGPFVIEMWAKQQSLDVCQKNLAVAVKRVHRAMDMANYLTG